VLQTLFQRIYDYNRKCLNNRTGQRSVFSWCSLSRAHCISINLRIDLYALSPFVYSIDIRIPLSIVSQIEARSSKFYRKIFRRNLISFIVSHFFTEVCRKKLFHRHDISRNFFHMIMIGTRSYFDLSMLHF